MKDKDLEKYRELAREFGKRGGRPREVMHSEGQYCLCVTCRKARANKRK